MKKVCAIIPAAGTGVRMRSKTEKPYITLKDKPLLWYCLHRLELSRRIDSIVIVCEKSSLLRTRKIVKRFNFKKVKAVISGGATRTESVRNGLKSLDGDTDFVLIHDGARPFVETELIDKCILAAIKHKAVVCAMPCVSTIKEADKDLQVTSTLDRNVLWEVQTPQVFAYELIQRAYQKSRTQKTGFFDDAALVERLGVKVKLLLGNSLNIKITTQEDLKLAKAILKLR